MVSISLCLTSLTENSSTPGDIDLNATSEIQNAYLIMIYIHTYMHAYILTCIHTYIHSYTYIYIHTYIHTYTHAYIHTYIHTHT